MSARQLKKLREKEELRLRVEKEAVAAASAGADDSAGSDDDDEEEVVDRRRPKNVFAAFSALDQDTEDDEDKDEADDNDDIVDGDDHLAAQPTKPKPSKKKKKKKAKTSKPKPDEADAVAEAAAAAPKGTKPRTGEPNRRTQKGGLDEIDRALAELKLKPHSPDPASSPNAVATTTSSSILKVNFHNLRVMNELREVFGSETIHAAAQGGGGPPRGERREGVLMVDLESFLQADPPLPPGMVRIGGGNHRPGAGAGDAVLRHNPFIQWKDTWPRATSGGLSMRQVTPAATGNKDGKTPVGGGVTEYTFVHSPAYAKLEETFFTMVTMHNPHAVVQFLKENPFHISSLIIVSRIAKNQDQNAALAADLCERALFSFGRSTLSSFRQALAEGRARLSFRRPENRQFLLAGFYYISSLIPRGTYRTALAWSRLLLSVFPDTDDYGVLLYAHALAVRAFEAQWLIDLFGNVEDDNDKDGVSAAATAVLPALARNPMRLYLRQTLVPARLQRKDRDGARAALQNGMARLPWLYGALYQALGLGVPRTLWGIQPRDDAESLYTELYLHVAKDLWDVGEATSLLRVAAAEIATAEERPKIDLSALPAAEPVPANLARFVYLDGTPALMALVPRALLHAVPNYDFDPLPPPRDDNEFSNQVQALPWLMVEEAGGLRQYVDLDALVGGRMDDPGLDIDAEADSFDEGHEGLDDSEDDTGPEVAEVRPERRDGGGGSNMPGAWVESDDEN